MSKKNKTGEKVAFWLLAVFVVFSFICGIIMVSWILIKLYTDTKEQKNHEKQIKEEFCTNVCKDSDFSIKKGYCYCSNGEKIVIE